MGCFVLYVKYSELVASGVQNCSVVSDDLKNPAAFATVLETFSTPPIDLAWSILKLIVFL